MNKFEGTAEKVMKSRKRIRNKTEHLRIPLLTGKKTPPDETE